MSRPSSGPARLVTTAMTMDFELIVDDDHCDPAELSVLIDRIGAELRRIEHAFSTFVADSWVSQLNRGEVTVAECPSEVAEVVGECDRFAALTEGAFCPSTPDGTFDPAGIVKTWAMQRVVPQIEAIGARRWLWGCGGDGIVGGTEPHPWSVGVADPRVPASVGQMIDVVTLDPTRQAVATSGTAEHGAHIWAPDGRSAGSVLSATVVGADLVTCDAWATALVAGGEPTAQLAAGLGVQFMVVGANNGQLTARRTPGWPRPDARRDQGRRWSPR